jgi:hypothetical protein
MADFEMKANDLKPSIAATLGFEGVTPSSPLEGTVQFIMRRIGVTPAATSAKVTGDAVIVDAAAWQVRYDWAPGDTNAPGDYVAEWEVTDALGKPQTFPGDSYHSVKIYPDLDGAA